MARETSTQQFTAKVYSRSLGALVSADFRAIEGDGIEVRTANGFGVLLGPDDAAALFGWLGRTLRLGETCAVCGAFSIPASCDHAKEEN